MAWPPYGSSTTPSTYRRVGKTMLSIGLARAAVEAGHRVYCTPAAELAARCHKAASLPHVLILSAV